MNLGEIRVGNETFFGLYTPLLLVRCLWRHPSSQAEISEQREERQRPLAIN